MPRKRPAPREDLAALNQYDEAEALRLKTPSPSPPVKRRRGKDRPDEKKEKKKKKKHKEGSSDAKKVKDRRRDASASQNMPYGYGGYGAGYGAYGGYGGYGGGGFMPMPMPSMPMPSMPMPHLAAQSLPQKNIFTPSGPSIVPEEAPMIPTLHSVLTGEVQMLTPKGALLRLSDQRSVRYLDGLLRRPEQKLKIGEKCFVKVARIEAGLVMVDTKDVDQEVGKDLDPEHEKAEVEEWIDVPAALVGRIIGRKGERIRQICDESNADLRFDETKTELGSNTKRRTTGGAGDDLRKFLAAAQEGAAKDEEPQESADDLRAFLEEAQANRSPQQMEPEEEGEVQEAAGDLAAFLQEAKAGDGAAEALPARRSFVSAVEFVAYSLENWDELLYRKMGEAGVSLVYPENLSITDKEGKAVDIERGLRYRHFPIRVRYILTSETPKDAEEGPAAKPEDEERKNTKAKVATRKDAIFISCADGLSKRQLSEVFKSKSLPEPVTLDNVSETDLVCVFQDVSDAQRAASGLEGHPRVSFRMATMEDIRQKAFNRFKQPPQEEFMRLRINGDVLNVRKAQRLVLDLLDELTSGRPIKTRPGVDEVEQSFSVPVGRIGHLIGKAGQNIKTLEKETGARLKVLPAEGQEEQELLVSGTVKQVELAKQQLRKYIPHLELDPTASGVPERRKLAAADSAAEEAEPGEDLSKKRARAAEVLEAAGRAKEEAPRSPSRGSGRTRMKRLRERKRGISLDEYQIMLRKQKELDAAAARAEEAAEVAKAFARKAAQEEQHRHVDEFDWEEEDRSNLSAWALTSFGAGRLSRVVSTPFGQLLSFQLLSGGSLQVPEASGLPWLLALEGFLGTKVKAPEPWEETGGKPPLGATWVVSEVQPQGRRLVFRLVTAAELFPRFVEASRLSSWPRVESPVYLVELCTTPATVGHIMPYRHDFRKSDKSYVKGDWLLLEGSRPGLQDVGIVRKVLHGAKGEQAAAIAAKKDPTNLEGAPLRLAQRCGAAEKTRREQQIATLERAVLPLLAARLPSGAAALGVGASLDGTFLRFFVRLPGQPDQESPLAPGAAASAAAVGALLGCQSEVFATSGPAEPQVEPPEKTKDKAPKAKPKDRKAKEKKSSSSSSESSSDQFLLAMAKRGDKALARTARADAAACAAQAAEAPEVPT
ncbi:unnamed protein product [Effrenium voratum]|uniref:K Homology domain-containing protein n=1 Tax=Effrenium voratum TaxID=2562239 RepID=A0AA36HRH5_9DINO|nr:unnamed protein product [Effrenium voratum]